jgi:hypothetical protein
VSIAFQEKDRPVLNLASSRQSNFPLELFRDFALREGAAD